LLYAAFHAGQMVDFMIPVTMIIMFGLVFYYFGSLKLVLADDHITYRAMWRSREVPIGNIQGVERGRGPFGVGATWIVHAKDYRAPIVVNVTNFDVRAFAKALLAKNAGIRFSALKL
jgi:hypothetical protein